MHAGAPGRQAACVTCQRRPGCVLILLPPTRKSGPLILANSFLYNRSVTSHILRLVYGLGGHMEACHRQFELALLITDSRHSRLPAMLRGFFSCGPKRFMEACPFRTRNSPLKYVSWHIQRLWSSPTRYHLVPEHVY